LMSTAGEIFNPIRCVGQPAAQAELGIGNYDRHGDHFKTLPLNGAHFPQDHHF
jgi:hypothetical protein